jgi:hypothetical protein
MLQHGQYRHSKIRVSFGLLFVCAFEVDESFSVFEAFFEDLVFGFFCCACGDLPGHFFEDGLTLVVSEGPWRVLYDRSEVKKQLTH